MAEHCRTHVRSAIRGGWRSREPLEINRKIPNTRADAGISHAIIESLSETEKAIAAIPKFIARTSEMGGPGNPLGLNIVYAVC